MLGMMYQNIRCSETHQKRMRFCVTRKLLRFMDKYSGLQAGGIYRGVAIRNPIALFPS